jgi:hypothetical protein
MRLAACCTGMRLAAATPTRLQISPTFIAASMDRVDAAGTAYRALSTGLELALAVSQKRERCAEHGARWRTYT